MDFQKDDYGISMVIPRCFYGISLGFLWGFHDNSMIFLWAYYGMSIESKLKSIEHNFELN
jgi:hypothetical protein